MITVTVDEKYAEVLGALGNAQDAFDLAIQRYTIEEITRKIAELRQRIERYEVKYQNNYRTFVKRMAVDEQFVSDVERDIDAAWEIDLLDWEFSQKGIEDWTRKLQTILLG